MGILEGLAWAAWGARRTEVRAGVEARARNGRNRAIEGAYGGCGGRGRQVGALLRVLRVGAGKAKIGFRGLGEVKVRERRVGAEVETA